MIALTLLFLGTVNNLLLVCRFKKCIKYLLYLCKHILKKKVEEISKNYSQFVTFIFPCCKEVSVAKNDWYSISKTMLH